MALLDDVKSELAAIDNELPIAKKAQATAMIRFGNGLHSVDHHILVQAQLDSQDAAIWLQDTIRNLYGHEATLTPVSRQTPTGVVQRFIVRVPKGSAALVLQTGLYSRYTKNMVLGLPGDIINGKIAQIKADAEAAAAALQGVELLTIAAKTGANDTIYGSVGALQIAEALAKLGHNVDRKIIVVKDAVKTLGKYTCTVKLHKEVSVEIPFEVVAETAEA